MDDLTELQALSWEQIFTLAEGLTCEANTLHLQGEQFSHSQQVTHTQFSHQQVTHTHTHTQVSHS